MPSVSALYLADPQEVGAPGAVGVGLAVCWVSAGLGRLEAEEELVRLVRKCRNWDDFWALHSWSKQTAWRNRSVEEGNFACLFHLFHHEPEVALQHYKAGHWTPDGLGGGFGGA